LENSIVFYPAIQLVENFDGEEEKKESFFLWIEYPTLIFKPNPI